MANIRYKNYPARIVIISNLVSLGIYAVGAFVILKLGIIWLAFYLLYIVFLEIRLLGKSCVNCSYYGKVCAFGKGKISSLFFKQGDPKLFCQRQITWKDIIPDFLASIIPLIAGIILLIISFDPMLLYLLIILVLLTSFGNSIVRSKLACKHCRQADNCPALRLFSKDKK
jgi:hypothetical protein